MSKLNFNKNVAVVVGLEQVPEDQTDRESNSTTESCSSVSQAGASFEEEQRDYSDSNERAHECKIHVFSKSNEVCKNKLSNRPKVQNTSRGIKTILDGIRQNSVLRGVKSEDSVSRNSVESIVKTM